MGLFKQWYAIKTYCTPLLENPIIAIIATFTFPPPSLSRSLTSSSP